MLQIKEIKKQYRTGDYVQNALDGVDLNLRNSEFVAILGPSGSGKTTLLNIVGGLDRYDSGDLIINNISTKKYRDRDWDSYRNHTVGFVFQNYNLISHQSVLSNVELALTISGISKSERKKRAIAALEQVGLAEHLHKRPNQMSGGQMQRVAIARSLVNNPKILLADEPTGALDSDTSSQIMELLKEVAKDRLVVMVTHDSEIAETYATRIVKLRDGKIIADSKPFQPETENLPEAKHENMGKSSMSFRTALSLSFNNLKTKKGRTILTAFAGSIGIIGIALILALSSGVNNYIEDVQRETMTAYPLSISAQTFDMEAMMMESMELGMSMQGAMMDDTGTERTEVYADDSMLEMQQTMESNIIENDLTAFKNYLDDPNSEIAQYIGSNGVIYSYDVKFDVFTADADDNILNTNTDPEKDSSVGMSMNPMMMMAGNLGSAGARNFSQIMPGANGENISQVVTDSYELVSGAYPENYDEVVLVLNNQNEISTTTLYQLGFITEDEYEETKEKIYNEEDFTPKQWSYEELISKIFMLVPYSDYYVKDENGKTYEYKGDDEMYISELVEDALELEVVGIIRPTGAMTDNSIYTGVAYTKQLTDHVIKHTNESDVIIDQESDEEINVLTGFVFETPNEQQQLDEAYEYLSSMSVEEKAEFYSYLMYMQAQMAENEAANDPSGGMTAQAFAGGAPMAPMDDVGMAAALDAWLEGEPEEEVLFAVYEEFLAQNTYKENMSDFGKVSYHAPSEISIYIDGFADKDGISLSIENYNISVNEEEQIEYTDYVALMTSSMTTIIDVISYVLIAFVSVSLVVSCIMIGIITHISVMERTKEIGILRAIGASKRNISQVFNAETLIIGLCSGGIGVGLSALMTIPINAIIHSLVGNTDVNAVLPLEAAVLLIIISVIITVIGGLMPAKKASKKDPVIALRTE